MNWYERIRSYYIDGYGFPKKYYTDKNLASLVKMGKITQEQADQIKAEKAAKETGGVE